MSNPHLSTAAPRVHQTGRNQGAQMQVQLWDLPRLTSLFLENHTHLPEAVADLVPMRQIWVLDEADEAESDQQQG